jgi:hypothetical protein
MEKGPGRVKAYGKMAIVVTVRRRRGVGVGVGVGLGSGLGLGCRCRNRVMDKQVALERRTACYGSIY